MTDYEDWKEIKGFPNYMISNFGNVWNKKRNRTVSTSKNNHGYMQVCLYNNGKKTVKTVHRIVAEAFLPNIYERDEVNHKDENKTNNNVNNLEWCNRKYNANYGTAIERTKEKKYKKTFMMDKITSKILKEFSSMQEASKETGIDYNNICSVCVNKRLTAGGYKWAHR